MARTTDRPSPADLARGRAVIEHVAPEIDCGRFRAKAVVGDEVQVQADIFRDSTDVLRAAIRYRGPSGRWQEAPMSPVENDRWSGSFPVSEMGRYRYQIVAWTDPYWTWARDLRTKAEAGQDVSVELEAGALLFESRIEGLPAKDKKVLTSAVAAMRGKGSGGGLDGVTPLVAAALSGEVEKVIASAPDRSDSTQSSVLELTVDRERARFGAWYEFFPRSTGTKTKHGTFKTAAKHLNRIAGMGFDVVYLPPIHPIGRAFRKGKNNTLEAGPKDVGVPWAIGSDEGGHKDVHPELGTIEDFDEFVAQASRLGLEVALDFAIQCSPDHPWVKEHPDWFEHRADGSIRYAENPPNEYQDVCRVDFDTQD
ncbi:MAG TPA: maltotransferase domain-containing protein, partial [Actinomycetota bacterium]|nr:maltotransferase domain-containing protein [Actinomycetota bacterium]